MNPRTPDQQLIKVFTALCDEAGSPLGRSLKQAAIRGDWLTVVQTKVNPIDYADSESYYKDAVIGNFLRKLPIDIPGVKPSETTVASFWTNERHNHRTNLRLMRFSDNYGLAQCDLPVLSFFSDVKRRISSIVGKVPDDLVGKFGKGSTFTDVGKYTTLPDKMSNRPSITPGSRDLLPLLGDSAWFRGLMSDHPNKSDPETVRGNRFTTVAKTALVDRGICIEPSLNVYLQLAIGSHLTARLKKSGLNKEKSQDLHRLLARLASITGDLATLDLSDASDLVSYQLVKLVMPDEWFELLCATRSEFTQVENKWVRVEKFSSMGNGFTFELMTLILLSISWELAVKQGLVVNVGANLSVYGDDIIVPTELSTDLIACLAFCGLKVNARKTFTTGPFRESCGGDFFDGQDVSPYYLKEFPNEPQQHISLANGIRRLGRQHRSDAATFPQFRKPWFRALDRLPSSIRRLRGPEQLGDVVVHDDPDRWLEPRGARRKNLAFRETPDMRKFVRAYVPVKKVLPLALWSPSVQLAVALYGVPSDGIVPRKGRDDVVTGYRLRWIPIGW